MVSNSGVRDALGRVSVYEHDARQDIVAVRDALGQITRTPFDANGHPKGSTDALGRSSSTVFDARGNLTPEFDTSTPFFRHLPGWGPYESST